MDGYERKNENYFKLKWTILIFFVYLKMSTSVFIPELYYNVNKLLFIYFDRCTFLPRYVTWIQNIFQSAQIVRYYTLFNIKKQSR